MNNIPIIKPLQTNSLEDYFETEKSTIQETLLRDGAILFRGFNEISTEEFQQLSESYAEEIMGHSVRLTHRTAITDKINTSTEYNNKLKILLHTENSFCSLFPKEMFFYCVTPSPVQGETPLSDVSAVYEELKPSTREKFEELGVLYVRNFWPGFGPEWKNVFNVTTEKELEEYCKENSISIEWKEQGRPKLTQKWPAVITHPKTGRKVWFNHATTSNLLSVPAALRMMIEEGFSQEDYPNNTYYGDGSVIEPEVLQEINEAYAKFEFQEPWEKGDLLLVDNLRLAHGRNPFEGERKILVAMMNPHFRTFN